MEIRSDEITCCIDVDRTRGLLEKLGAMESWKKIITADNIDAISIPKGGGEKAKVVFFPPRLYIRPIKLGGVYGARDLIPADPLSIAAIAEADPAFFNNRICCTQWGDAAGDYCYIAFGRLKNGIFASSNGSHYVILGPRTWPYPEHLWFAGFRK